MEYVEIVNDNNNILKIVSYDEMIEGSLLHRGSRVIIVTSDGKIYISKRSKNLRTSPGLYDLGAGGLKDAGENMEDCAKRELQEELGIKATELEFLFEYKHRSPKDNYNLMVYLYVYDGPITIQQEELDEGLFIPLSDLKKFVEKNKFAPGRKEIANKLIELKTQDRLLNNP